MAVGLKSLPKHAPIPGIRVACGAAAISKAGRDDLALFELGPNSS